MAISSIINILYVGTAYNVGFWLSHGRAGLFAGPMLTVTEYGSKYISNGFLLFIAWALSRFAQVLDLLVFCAIFQQTRCSMADSQYATLVVNNKVPLDTFLQSI